MSSTGAKRRTCGEVIGVQAVSRREIAARRRLIVVVTVSVLALGLASLWTVRTLRANEASSARADTVSAQERVLPGPDTTGVPAGTELESYEGPTRITTPNTVIDKQEIAGPIIVAAPGVVITSSRLSGTFDDAFGILVERGDVTISTSEISGSPD